MTLKQWLAVDAPAGWPGVLARTVTMTLLGFVVFQVKEWSETGGVDTPDALIGAGWLAATTFVASGFHSLLRSRPAR
jgi:heme/copper-type cytochrome/quinol oxidase subunit 3